MTLLRIAGGTVVDPANGVDGAVADLWIEGGRVVAAPADPDVRPTRTIDARGDVVMAAGVDVHCHIAGPKVNAARMLRPEEARREPGTPRTGSTRSGTGGSVPSTFSTGYRYAGLGYGTAVDAAVPPLGARQAHRELVDTPVIDKAFLILMGNNHRVMDCIRAGDRAGLRDTMAWLLGATRGYGVKVVNPGGVERWKQGRGNVSGLDQVVEGFDVSPRQILIGLVDAAEALGLPHPVHVHGLNLGLPGVDATTLETLRALDGRRAHMAHVQFHSYTARSGKGGGFDSGVPALADWINTHDGVSVDVGQVLFGETTSMTADGAVGQFLHEVTGRKWLSHDVEAETGCGVVPITYEDTNRVHALQWAIGLEWFLRVDDPWRIALSTDHPNGGSFLAYPRIIALLMDPQLRRDALAALPDRVRARSGLADLPRAYSLAEIAVVTRAGPARMLGLARKGHLGVGADADVTIYRPDDDRERMFSMPRYVLKAGEVVLDDGALRATPQGRHLRVEPGYDAGSVAEIAEWFEESHAMRFANFGMDEADGWTSEVVACRGSGT